MKKLFFLLSVVLSLQLFSQGNKYWIKFKDKNDNSYSLNNPRQFLSQASIDRRSKQNISLNESDLPLTQSYVDSVSPYISRLIHRLKWFNLIVVQIDDPGMIETDITETKDTIYQTDTASITIYDSVITWYKATVTLSGIFYDTLSFFSSDTIYDSIAHPGPIIIRNVIYMRDVSTGNKFDSIKKLPGVDSLAEIPVIPPRSFKMQDKFEEVRPVDQHIVYPSRYGAAFHQINMLNADLLHQMGYRGEGITISVMDNGFNNADKVAAYDSVRSRILATWDFVNNEANVYNDGGHGANTFSCIAANIPGRYLGTAPDANFCLLVTEDNTAEWVMEEYNWAASAEFADSAGAHIFSTSLGYTNFDNSIGSHTYADLNGDKTVITRAGNLAFAKGILVLNSAGNEGAKAWHYISAPADGDSILAIGAVDSAEVVVAFSGRGPSVSGRIKPDICAQGAKCAMLATNGNIGFGDGTSFSCPIMAGCAASLWSAFPDKSAREIYDAIVISADNFWSPDNNHGYGIPNFYNAYFFLKTNYNSNILRISNDAAMYPNPFAGELNVALFNAESKDRKIEIWDLLGRKIYSRDFFIRENTFDILRIEEAQQFPAGEYIVKLDGEKDFNHRIIKVK